FKTKRKILLENSAGLGNCIGTSLDEMSVLLSLISPTLQDNVGICIDTCHAYDAAQYDFGNPLVVEKFYNDIDTKIPGKLKLFHLNDS
ncbi:TIM barrel protein, partial [Klebsiella pneumoniae]|nr:TIM barrel protein [Klebsiella pneumoniae]